MLGLGERGSPKTKLSPTIILGGKLREYGGGVRGGGGCLLDCRKRTLHVPFQRTGKGGVSNAGGVPVKPGNKLSVILRNCGRKNFNKL